MLPASLAADVPLFIATPTSAWASAGASLVPSPVIATSLPPSCSRLMSAILSSGLASARKSSTPASSAIALAVNGLSPVIITVRMPIRRSSSNRSAMPCLTMSFSATTPSTQRRAVALLGDDQRSAAGGADRVDGDDRRRRGSAPPLSRTHLMHSRRRALADLAAFDVDAAHPRLRGERHEVRTVHLPLAQPVLVLGEHDDRAALRASRRPATTAGRRRPARRSGTPVDRHEVGRLPVAERDRAGLVQQQRVDVAGRLDRASAHRQHVALHEPVHAGDADRRQQRADRRRDQADQQRHQHDAGDALAVQCGRVGDSRVGSPSRRWRAAAR